LYFCMLEKECFDRLMSLDNNVDNVSGGENYFSIRATHS